MDSIKDGFITIYFRMQINLKNAKLYSKVDYNSNLELNHFSMLLSYSHNLKNK